MVETNQITKTRPAQDDDVIKALTPDRSDQLPHEPVCQGDRTEIGVPIYLCIYGCETPNKGARIGVFVVTNDEAWWLTPASLRPGPRFWGSGTARSQSIDQETSLDAFGLCPRVMANLEAFESNRRHIERTIITSTGDQMWRRVPHLISQMCKKVSLFF
jgi:hypothetical protein